jgi:hypothetical protein
MSAERILPQEGTARSLCVDDSWGKCAPAVLCGTEGGHYLSNSSVAYYPMSDSIKSAKEEVNPFVSSSTSRVSSPASTGGAGPVFEQHVGAYWLAQLLVGGIPPILIDCSVVEVNFQRNASAGTLTIF